MVTIEIETKVNQVFLKGIMQVLLEHLQLNRISSVLDKVWAITPDIYETSFIGDIRNDHQMLIEVWSGSEIRSDQTKHNKHSTNQSILLEI